MFQLFPLKEKHEPGGSVDGFCDVTRRHKKLRTSTTSNNSRGKRRKSKVLHADGKQHLSVNYFVIVAHVFQTSTEDDGRDANRTRNSYQATRSVKVT